MLKVDEYFEESFPEAEVGRSKNFFNKEGSVGIDVKVPRTSNLERLISVNACAEEVQNCRQITAINTVILTERQSNETSEAQGNLWHRTSP